MVENAFTIANPMMESGAELIMKSHFLAEKPKDYVSQMELVLELQMLV